MNSGSKSQKLKPYIISLNHILVVEDDAITQIVTRLLLKDYFNCDVTVVSFGMEAQKIAEKIHFDLIILDIGLPDIDGFEVAKRLRTRPSHNQKTSIIGVSAHVLDWQLEKKHYLDAFLPKPITYELCDQLVEKLCLLYDG